MTQPMNQQPRSGPGDARPAGSVVTVNIFGADYAIRGGADIEYIRLVAAHVDGLMRNVSGRVKHASATRIAVLAAMQLTDQLFSERREASAGRQGLRELAEQTDSLLSRLDQTLLEVVE